MLRLTKYFQTNLPSFWRHEKHARLANAPFKVKICSPDWFTCIWLSWNASVDVTVTWATVWRGLHLLKEQQGEHNWFSPSYGHPLKGLNPSCVLGLGASAMARKLYLAWLLSDAQQMRICQEQKNQRTLIFHNLIILLEWNAGICWGS